MNNKLKIIYSIVLIFLSIPIGFAWVYTTPPDSILDQNGFRFGNTNISSDSINATNYTTSQGRHLENGGCDASYCIRHNLTNSSIIEALNGSTGIVDYSGNNATIVINNTLHNLTLGRDWKETVIIKGNHNVSSFTIQSYTTLKFERLVEMTGVNSHLIQNDDIINGNTQIDIEGDVDGNVNGQTEDSRAIYLVKVTDSKLDVKISNTYGHGLHCVQCDSVDITIVARNIGQSSIGLTGSNNITVKVDSIGAGKVQTGSNIKIDGGNNIKIDGRAIDASTGHGVYIDSAFSSGSNIEISVTSQNNNDSGLAVTSQNPYQLKDIRVIGGEYSNNTYGVWFNNLNDSLIISSSIHDNYNGIYIAGNNRSYNNTITSNRIYSNSNRGIIVNDYQYWHNIINNQLRGNPNPQISINASRACCVGSNFGYAGYNWGVTNIDVNANGFGDEYSNSMSGLKYLSNLTHIFNPYMTLNKFTAGNSGITLTQNATDGTLTINATSTLPQCPSTSPVNGSTCLNYTTGAQNNYFNGNWVYTNGTII